MSPPPPALKIKVQIYCGAEIAMGPGKADLLDAIVQHGSISAAGRALGMSYRRTWLLVDTMNRCWSAPLVATSSGGAEVTALGMAVLNRFRALQGHAAAAGLSHDWLALQESLMAAPLEHQASGLPAAAPDG
jgi:molybdate transport system regulatory protein